MKFTRLKKIALGGNIQKSDIGFNYEGNQIQLIITNPDKALHDLTVDWSGQFFSGSDSGDVIGFIQYEEMDQNDKHVIYVVYMETRDEYRSTRAVKFLMDEFKTNVLDPTIEHYGKENVLLQSEVINPELKDFLERVTKKLGLGFDPDSKHDLNEDYLDYFNSLHEDDPEVYTEEESDEEESDELAEELKNAGATLIDDLGRIVSNFSLESYKEIVNSIYGEETATELYGYVDMDNGDIIVSLYQDTTGTSKEILYNTENKTIWLDGVIGDYKNISEAFIQNLNIVTQGLYKIDVNEQKYSLEELTEQFQPVVANSKIKRLIKLNK